MATEAQLSQPSEQVSKRVSPAILRKSTVGFLSRIGFRPGAKIWLKSSWDLPFSFAPNDWEYYQRNGKKVLRHIVYQGRITKTGFTLRRCMPKGKRQNGKPKWVPEGDLHVDGWKFMYRLSKKGATVSFYPNQPTDGIDNDAVNQCYCLFYEIDDQSINQQKLAIKQLQRQTKLTPTAVVYSGNKSLHVYFRCSKPVDPETWLRLNRKLCIVQNSDPQICNLGRAMRLPGMLRRKVVGDALSTPILVELLASLKQRFTPQDVEDKLDSIGLFPHGLDEYRWRRWWKLYRKQQNGEDVDPISALLQPPNQKKRMAENLRQGEKYTLPNSDYSGYSHSSRDSGDGSVIIPLEKCLTIDDENLVAYGTNEGSRHISGFRLACDLIGTAGFLNSRQVRYQPQPEVLFRSYCSRCSPPVDDLEADQIWSSVSSEPREPSRSEDSIMNTVNYYHRPKPATSSRITALQEAIRLARNKLKNA